MLGGVLGYFLFVASPALAQAAGQRELLGSIDYTALGTGAGGVVATVGVAALGYKTARSEEERRAVREARQEQIRVIDELFSRCNELIDAITSHKGADGPSQEFRDRVRSSMIALGNAQMKVADKRLINLTDDLYTEADTLRQSNDPVQIARSEKMALELMNDIRSQARTRRAQLESNRDEPDEQQETRQAA